MLVNNLSVKRSVLDNYLIDKRRKCLSATLLIIGISFLAGGEYEVKLTYRSLGVDLGCIISGTTYLIIITSFYYNSKSVRKLLQINLRQFFIEYCIY